MTDSTLVATDFFSTEYTVVFRADERYSLSWLLLEIGDGDLAYPISSETKSGKATIVSAGQSLTSIDVSGSLLTVPGGDSADKQLFTTLLPLCKKTMGSRDGSNEYLLATLTLQLSDTESVVITGWVKNFIADRDAPEGLVEIKITFNFLFDDDPIFT